MTSFVSGNDLNTSPVNSKAATSPTRSLLPTSSPGKRQQLESSSTSLNEGSEEAMHPSTWNEEEDVGEERRGSDATSPVPTSSLRRKAGREDDTEDGTPTTGHNPISSTIQPPTSPSRKKARQVNGDEEDQSRPFIHPERAEAPEETSLEDEVQGTPAFEVAVKNAKAVAEKLTELKGELAARLEDGFKASTNPLFAPIKKKTLEDYKRERASRLLTSGEGSASQPPSADSTNSDTAGFDHLQSPPPPPPPDHPSEVVTTHLSPASSMLMSHPSAYVSGLTGGGATGGNLMMARALPPGMVAQEMMIPNALVGLVIGKGGETLKRVQAMFNVRVQLSDIPNAMNERTATITGILADIEQAKIELSNIMATSTAGRLGGGGGPGDAFSRPATIIPIPLGKVGLIIGKGGETIKMLQMDSGAKINVNQDAPEPGSQMRSVSLSGSDQSVEMATRLINDLLNNHNRATLPDAPNATIKVPHDRVGLVIGRAGVNLSEIRNTLGVHVQVEKESGPDGMRSVHLTGPSMAQIERAQQVIFSKIAPLEHGMGGAGGGAGFYQQQPYSGAGMYQQPYAGTAAYGGYGAPQPAYGGGQQQYAAQGSAYYGGAYGATGYDQQAYAASYGAPQPGAYGSAQPQAADPYAYAQQPAQSAATEASAGSTQQQSGQQEGSFDPSTLSLEEQQKYFAWLASQGYPGYEAYLEPSA